MMTADYMKWEARQSEDCTRMPRLRRPRLEHLSHRSLAAACVQL